MKPPKKQFEQVKVDEWLIGEIIDIQYEKDHEFKFKGVSSTDTAVRIFLSLDGYKDKKSTGWMRFNYGEKSNLYKKFITTLVEGAHPNMDFDLDILKNLRIKVMYAQNGEYQNIVLVRPDAGKVLPRSSPVASKAEEETDEVPF